jgi:chemotaxis-related protein WspD
MSASSLALPVVVDCWNTIGVRGDRSCKELVEVRHCHHCPVFARAAHTLLERPAPAGYLEEATALLGKSPAQSEPFNLSTVLFEVQDQTLAIDTKSVVEVTEPRAVHRIGHRTGRVFSGIVNIHGQLELCASLQGLLQIPNRTSAPAAASARMLLIEHLGRRWVFGADAVHGVCRFRAGDVSEVPATLQNAQRYIQSMLSWNERRVGYLDVDKTILALEDSVR